MTIDKKIIILRKNNNLSQDDLVALLGISRQSLFKWEKGLAVPQTEKVIELSKIFKVSFDLLIDDNVELTDLSDDSGKGYPSKYLLTNGYRGEANKELTSDIAYKIGRFLGWYYCNPKYNKDVFDKKPSIVIGKDTRRSSYMFEFAIASGVASSGADVYMMHVTTTPSIGYIVNNEQFECGVMVTASHNPSFDNGIKLVTKDGELVDENLIYLLESYLSGNLKPLGIDDKDLPFAKRADIGIIKDFESGRDKYINYLVSLSKYSFRNLRIGLDLSNGASYMIAKRVFEELGAQLFIINDKPDGTNINDNSGSTHIEALSTLVIENNLDVGFAFDGDADRCIAIDEKGNEINGDKIIYLLANKLKDNRALNKNTVVISEMSNTGLIGALKERDIKTVIADVGDRNVLEEMINGNYSLGGEQSGHVLLRKYASTSDGIIAAILILEEMIDKKQKPSELVARVTLMPQLTESIEVNNKEAVLNNELVQSKYKEITDRLGNKGRILLRTSKTEPVIRVMVECSNIKKNKECIDEMSATIKSAI